MPITTVDFNHNRIFDEKVYNIMVDGILLLVRHSPSIQPLLDSIFYFATNAGVVYAIVCICLAVATTRTVFPIAVLVTKKLFTAYFAILFDSSVFTSPACTSSVVRAGGRTVLIRFFSGRGRTVFGATQATSVGFEKVDRTVYPLTLARAEAFAAYQGGESLNVYTALLALHNNRSGEVARALLRAKTFCLSWRRVIGNTALFADLEHKKNLLLGVESFA